MITVDDTGTGHQHSFPHFWLVTIPVHNTLCRKLKWHLYIPVIIIDNFTCLRNSTIFPVELLFTHDMGSFWVHQHYRLMSLWTFPLTSASRSTLNIQSLMSGVYDNWSNNVFKILYFQRISIIWFRNCLNLKYWDILDLTSNLNHVKKIN